MSLKVPAALIPITSQAGAHRKGIKVLVYGPPKTGKSFFLASFPKPILAAACGEPGIEPYLEPTVYDDNGNWVSGDLCMAVSTPAEYGAFLEFGLSHSEFIGSVVFDNYNLLWDDWIDNMQEELGVDEIKAGLWKQVKGPWKKHLRDIMRAETHIGIGAWHKDILYSQEKGMPGEQGKLKIYQQDNPNVEKTVPYVIDLIFKTDVERDSLFKPTGRHVVTFYGGRRPRSVSPSDLYTGRAWEFSSKKPPVSVWHEVVGPFFDKWTEGAVDHLGIDPQEAQLQVKGVEKAWQDEAVGRLVGQIEAYDGDMEGYKVLFQQISIDAKPLTPERVAVIKKAHEAKKKGLK